MSDGVDPWARRERVLVGSDGLVDLLSRSVIVVGYP